MGETKVVNKRDCKTGIYAGRGSIWGNPYTHISDKKTKAEFIVSTREESIEKFKEYFFERIASDSDFKKKTLLLRGETLICYCKPLSCHLDIVKEWLDKQ